jgi:hypothetical protein
MLSEVDISFKVFSSNYSITDIDVAFVAHQVGLTYLCPRVIY